MYKTFEKMIDIFRDHDTHEILDHNQRASVWNFYWNYISQVKGSMILLFVAGFVTAIVDLSIPLFIGRITGYVSHAKSDALPVNELHAILIMAFVIIVLRPFIHFFHDLVTNQTIAANFTNLIRWQNHRGLIRQGWGFFQNDFAGRIANRVMQTGPSLRESTVATLTAVWYLLTYGISSIIILAQQSWTLSTPVFLWFLFYGFLMWFFIPRLTQRSNMLSKARSGLTGAIVDSYTNIHTVKLFAKSEDEDQFVRDALISHTSAFWASLRMVTTWMTSLTMLNALLLSATTGVGLWLWHEGTISVGILVTAIPLVWQIANMSGWVANNLSAIFENIGTVQDGMRSVDRPRIMGDMPLAKPFVFESGRIDFADVSFSYHQQDGTVDEIKHIDHVSIAIAPGERVAIVGPSGSGKSTLVSLLLRFFDVNEGRILVDGQDVRGLQQESFRQFIGVVSQDTSLLHRSILDNVRYGRQNATREEVEDALRKARADAFVLDLVDSYGRVGLDAQVGERGVKLSGGQRQRIAIARVFLKNAPILILDEATSALDSVTEQEIQHELDALMAGRTVIAIAHRISTIAHFDRIIVMANGQVTEMGNHQQLLQANGHYAELWARQSKPMNR
ncbi:MULTISPECIES: ABC transporter ATP-binding protein [Acidithiobacillus]|jgi:ATP-binding cassette subfamily B multidrug efflux pump|uniref:ABC transporter, permease/ATP-binding protein n=1 Tax=Acidithiobacillus ferrooxidans (strain ATCC 23270 / DSM 14882 / CIP 104768 / NCIMB 8455) TaxID=243159 RepID=B7J9V8_ACIF2|nr:MULTISPECIES: ABC transporter ATP-binding protein [Acidithiobacillus]ACH84792.1 ABC transporter related [Acidithiobacillus ferrooxidans ATCC 53993]ACK79446.1 ABC transporter, permease/ATP-binding protein [Acidithiobacillus ferrooxidans ATCC 23270]MBN6743659.1 ABC transporter ATP-binding protein [Acidithiobacillus sp. MC2.2]MBN6746814.1 ABC transporter ATP-binding protein [Acidithiobacillus sp. PG05]MBU2773978.1 ABC transporter ATP-binding protein [Acidithiobacillus ferrooxidans]